MPVLVGHEGCSLSPPSISTIDCSLPNDVTEAIHLPEVPCTAWVALEISVDKPTGFNPNFFGDGLELCLFYNN